jgi:predicted RND superfamily exporter protein
MTSPPPRRWIERMVAYRWVLLAVAAALGAGSAVVGQRLSLDRSIENMFAADDPILVAYRRLQRTFGQYDVVLAVYADPELKSDAGVERARTLAERLKKVPGVVSALSIADPPAAADFANDGIGQRMREVFAGYTHNTQLTAAGALCLTERPQAGKTPRREILAGMREIVREYPQGAIIGEPVLIEDAFDLLEADGHRLSLWSTLLVMTVIVACFRSLRWLLLPLAVVQLALHGTRALLVVSDLQLSMVSSLLAAIITVIGVATVVHIMVHYLDLRRMGLPRRAALIQTIDELTWPITWAVLTDAAGFGALMVSQVGPIHDFGLMMAIGAMMTLPACALLVPGLIYVGDHGELPPPEKHGALTAVLMRMLRWSESHAGWLALGAVVLSVASVLGAQRLERETAFTNNFRKGTPIIQAYDFVEDEFGGAGVWDLMIPVSEAPTKRLDQADNDRPVPPAPLNGQFLAKVIVLERKLLDESPDELMKAVSIADSLAALVGSANAIARAPAFAISGAVRALRGKMPEFTASMYSLDPEDGRTWIHVLLRAPERLAAEEKLDLIGRVQTTAERSFPGAQTTGYYVLLADLIESVLDDQWKTFAVASMAVLFMTIVAFRNVPLAVASMVPNALPVMLLFGAMGWLGIKTNMGAAMIAAVSVGLSIDSSIHYVMIYQRRRREGQSMDDALAHAQDSAGRAATLSTLALIVGFSTLCVSDFVPTIYFGALVSLSMVGGLIGNILVQPMLIRKLDRAKYAQQST